ncbi:MAG: hypothetical protein ABSF43_15550 [Rectinemataceae bacterium]|jgi:hypothetical protein
MTGAFSAAELFPFPVFRIPWRASRLGAKFLYSTFCEDGVDVIGPNVDFIEGKDFAAEITIFNARQHGMTSGSAITSEHSTNNQAVRDPLLERGIGPESLPPVEDVKKVERRLASEGKRSLKNPDGLAGEE